MAKGAGTATTTASPSTDTTRKPACRKRSASAADLDPSDIKVQEYKDSLKAKAEELILKGLPQKIVELNELLITAKFQKHNLPDVHKKINIPVPNPASSTFSLLGNPVPKKWKPEVSMEEDSDTKVMSLAPVPCNKHVCDLMSVVKPHMWQLLEDAKAISMWISINIPKIESGNLFGVTIQEGTLSLVDAVETNANEFFELVSEYHIVRGKLVSKVTKYPHIEDYRRGVEEFDEMAYRKVWRSFIQLRNTYCTLHDLVIKNMEKLKKPRSSNGDTLY